MKNQLINDLFIGSQSVEFATNLMHDKIKFYENQINKNEHEEDIKALEIKIKGLQKHIFELNNIDFISKEV